MKLLLIQFRDEVMVSGEAASTRGLFIALQSLGMHVQNMKWAKRGFFGLPNPLAKLWQLRKIDWADISADAVIVKIPTAA